jgi:hypothetical protein
MMGKSIPHKSQRGVHDALKTGCGIGDEKLPIVTLRSPEGKQAPEGKRILSALSAAFMERNLSMWRLRCS